MEKIKLRRDEHATVVFRYEKDFTDADLAALNEVITEEFSDENKKSIPVLDMEDVKYIYDDNYTSGNDDLDEIHIKKLYKTYIWNNIKVKKNLYQFAYDFLNNMMWNLDANIVDTDTDYIEDKLM